MGKLPRYQRMGVRARQVQDTDYAGFRGQARTASTFSQAFSQMGKFLEAKAQEQAKQSGLERVRSEGAQPLLEQMNAQGGPRGLEEKTAYEAANRIARAEIASEAELEITNVLAEGQEKGQSYSTIQARLKDVTDGFSAALSDIDPVSAGVLRAQLQESSGKAELRYSKWWNGEVKRRTAKRNNDIAENTAETIIANAVTGTFANTNVSQKIIDAEIARGEERLLDLGSSPEQVQTWSDGVKKAAYRENIILKFNSADLNTQAQMLTQMETTPIAGMSLGETQTFRKSLASVYNSRTKVVKGAASDIKDEVKNQNTILAAGGMPSASTVLELDKAAEDLGGFGADAAKDLNDLKYNMELASAYRTMTPEQLAAEVKDLEKGLEGQGEDGVDTLVEAETLKLARSFLTAAETAASKAETERKGNWKPIIEGVEEKVKDLQVLVDSGKAVDFDVMKGLLEEISGFPEDLRQDLSDDVGVLRITSQVVSDMKGMTDSAATNYLKTIFAKGFENIGGEGIDTTEENSAYVLAKKIQSGMNAALKKDPLSYAVKVGTLDASGDPLEIKPINFTNPDATSESIQERIKAARIVSAKYSTPIKYLTPQEVSLLSDVLTSDQTDRGQRMAYLGAIVDGFGPASADVLAEIVETAPLYAGIGGLIVDGNMDAANIALRGRDSLDAGFKSIGFTPANTGPAFNGMTSFALQYQPNSIGITREVATAIYAHVARDTDTFDPDLWVKSIKMALGGDGDKIGGIQEVRGANTYLPSGVSANDVEAAMKAITPAFIAAASGGQVVGEDYAKKISGRGIASDNNYSLVNYSGTKYLIQFNKDGTNEPLYAGDQDGEKILIDLPMLIEATQ